MKKRNKSKKAINNKNNILIIVCMILIIAVVICLICKRKDITIIETDVKDKFIYLDIYDWEFDVQDRVFKDYYDFYNTFNSNLLNESDFESNNYVSIKVVYDECSESDIEPYNYKIDGENLLVTFKYNASCGVCAPRNIYYLFKVDKSIENAIVKTEFKANNNPHCNPAVSYKPMIYIYPTSDLEVNVQLGKPSLLTVTYPKYEGGWNVIAKPNGDLIDSKGKVYYGLYWEGLNFIDKEFEDGFVIKGIDSIDFLEEKLSILGLNEREANEFIVYWLPILEKNEYNLIRFETIDNINEQMPLNITPQPDTMIRVLMEYKPLKEKIDIQEQILTKTERKGYSVVEWGGTLIQ